MYSPIEKIQDDLFDSKGIDVYIKRDDLFAGALHGNKFRKLKYHLKSAQHLGKKKLLTFGGAFSNHLFATAAAGVKYDFETIGIVRGEFDPHNPTLSFLKKWNMQLSFVTRSEYRLRYKQSYLQSLQNAHADAYLIPEGGNHPLAIKGVSEMVQEIRSQMKLDFDYWICPVGTGSTAAGMVQALAPNQYVLACSVLKGLDTRELIASLLSKEPDELKNVVSIDASFGGFAKGNPELHQFISGFYKRHQIMLDPIYLGKTMHRLFQMIQADYFVSGSKILIIHTGGLQGIWGYNYLHGTNLPFPDASSFVIEG